MPSFNPSAPYFSERLQMRPPVMADLERFYAIFGDPQTQRFNPAGPLTSEAQAASALQERLAVWRQHGYGSGRSPCANGRIGLSVLAACPEAARRAAHR